MKYAMLLLFAVLITSSSAVAQTDCQSYFPFKNGATMEYGSYDKKGELQSQATHKITEVQSAGGALEATVETNVTTNKKDAEPIAGKYKVRCQDNTIFMDMSSMLVGTQATSAISNLEMTMTGDELQIPSKLTVGEALPDATMQMKAASGGVNLVSMTIKMVNRKVEAKETLQTAAGSFEAYKITYQTETKMLGTKTIDCAIWYTNGVGMVKQESYDKKGKLESKMELLKFEKGK